MVRFLSVSAILLASTMTASAAITYVDATDGAGGNTTLTNGDEWTATDDSDQSEAGLWDERSFGNNGTIYQNLGFNQASDDAHRLLTTISGLTNGATYNVYAYFWSDQSNTWKMNAGLADDAALPAFNTGNAPLASASTFVTDPVLSEDGGRRNLYQASLGTAVADGSGEIGVYIDDNDPVAADHNERTWYDGVGYQLVPEPASFALLTLGGLAATGIRRRRRR